MEEDEYDEPTVEDTLPAQEIWRSSWTAALAECA
ncbi:MAG: hypothetical protein QOK42_644 [Frankiaceae bacterium]|jgi:hypothetical protein|nr:hypothetical protein [Frankiaceae bacterium]